MKINAIQTSNQKQHPNFKMKIIPNSSIKSAVLTSRELMGPMYKIQNRGFVQEFCNSLLRITKSKQAESIWATMCTGNGERVSPCFVEELYKSGKSKKYYGLIVCKKKNINLAVCCILKKAGI